MDVGIRELRDGLSRYMAQVRKGHTLRVTDRGRVIARIVPPEEPSTLEQLIAEGLVDPPKSHVRRSARPVETEGTVSDLVIEQRR